MRRFLQGHAAPWCGLFLGFAGWALHHQVGSSLVFADCRLGQTTVLAGIGVACAGMALIGAGLSWAARGEGAGRPETRRFAALVGVSAAGLFLLAIVIQIMAGLLLPACHR